MKNPDQIFKDKLYDLETPLGGNVSFEKVMARRNKPAIPVWWKPAMLVVATLSVVSLTAYFIKPTGTNQGNSNHAAAQTGNSSGSDLHNQGNSKSALPAIKDKDQNTGKTGTVQTDNTADRTTGAVSGIPFHGSDGFTSGSDNHKNNTSGGTNTAAIESKTSLAQYLRSFGLRIFVTGNPAEYAKGNLSINPRDIPEPDKFVWPSVELMMNTGGRNYGFTGNNAWSSRGNHYFGQYSAIALWDIKGGIQLGAGFGFSQFMGNGEWRSLNVYNKQVIDTQTITIIQPGLPNKTITVYDTSTQQVKEVKSGNLNYRMSKISVPLAFRYHFGEGRTIWRLSGTVSPGMLANSTGSIFSKTETMGISDQTGNRFTMDARLGLGMHYVLNRRIAIVAEPGMVYQSVFGNQWKAYDRVTLGFGLGLVIKP